MRDWMKKRQGLALHTEACDLAEPSTPAIHFVAHSRCSTNPLVAVMIRSNYSSAP